MINQRESGQYEVGRGGGNVGGVKSSRYKTGVSYPACSAGLLLWATACRCHPQHAEASPYMSYLPYTRPHTFLSMSNHGLELNLISQLAPEKLRMAAPERLSHLGQNWGVIEDSIGESLERYLSIIWVICGGHFGGSRGRSTVLYCAQFSAQTCLTFLAFSSDQGIPGVQSMAMPWVCCASSNVFKQKLKSHTQSISST